MRGMSTAPIVFAIVVFGTIAAIMSYQWFYAQQKAVEAAAYLNAKVAEDQARCLGAAATGRGTVVVGGREYVNYIGLGCYVDSNIVIVVQWTK